MADLGINVIFEGRNLLRILEGLGVTVGISALSVVLSLVLGVFVGLGMRSRWRALRWLMLSAPRTRSPISAPPHRVNTRTDAVMPSRLIPATRVSPKYATKRRTSWGMMRTNSR